MAGRCTDRLNSKKNFAIGLIFQYIKYRLKIENLKPKADYHFFEFKPEHDSIISTLNIVAHLFEERNSEDLETILGNDADLFDADFLANFFLGGCMHLAADGEFSWTRVIALVAIAGIVAKRQPDKDWKEIAIWAGYSIEHYFGEWIEEQGGWNDLVSHYGVNVIEKYISRKKEKKFKFWNILSCILFYTVVRLLEQCIVQFA